MLFSHPPHPLKYYAILLSPLPILKQFITTHWCLPYSAASLISWLCSSWAGAGSFSPPIHILEYTKHFWEILFGIFFIQWNWTMCTQRMFGIFCTVKLNIFTLFKNIPQIWSVDSYRYPIHTIYDQECQLKTLCAKKSESLQLWNLMLGQKWQNRYIIGLQYLRMYISCKIALIYFN